MQYLIEKLEERKYVYFTRTNSEETTLEDVMEKFVRAWTDNVLHLGYRTTNIVESAHARLKTYLRSIEGDLASSWNEIDKMLAIQLFEIQTSFGRSRTVLEHKYKGNFLYT